MVLSREARLFLWLADRDLYHHHSSSLTRKASTVAWDVGLATVSDLTSSGFLGFGKPFKKVLGTLWRVLHGCRYNPEGKIKCDSNEKNRLWRWEMMTTWNWPKKPMRMPRSYLFLFRNKLSRQTWEAMGSDQRTAGERNKWDRVANCVQLPDKKAGSNLILNQKSVRTPTLNQGQNRTLQTSVWILYLKYSWSRDPSSKIHSTVTFVWRSVFGHKTMCKEDLALDDLQWLMCHKTQPNQILHIWYICLKRIWH